MQRSTVKWFDAKKGYGFITHPNGGEDVFVHYSNIESNDDFKTLHADQEVRFEMDDGPKGLHAPTVEPVDETGSEAPTEDEADDDFGDDFAESEIDPSEVDPTAEVDPTLSS